MNSNVQAMLNQAASNPEAMRDFVGRMGRQYPAPTDNDRALIGRVFNRLKAHVSAWKQTLTTPDIERMAKQEWFKSFIDHGIHSDEQIQGGFAYLRANTVTWWPSSAQFIEWCQENGGLDLPPVKSAYYEFCRNLGNLDQAKWTHPIVRVAGREAGNYEMASLPESESLPLFERAYKVLRERMSNGEDIDYPIPKGLPETVEIPLSRSENRSRLANLMGSL